MFRFPAVFLDHLLIYLHDFLLESGLFLLNVYDFRKIIIKSILLLKIKESG